MANLAIALSGGGYRASLFALGVLLYLVDVRKNTEVTSISSVSGGSITNAYIAQMKKFHEQDSQRFWEEIKPLTHTTAHKALWLSPQTWIYIFVLLFALFAITYGSFFGNSFPWWLKSVLFFSLLFPWGWILQQRGVIAGRAFGRNLYSPLGKPTTLEQIERNIDHVFCSTHLNEGEHFYFSGRFVYSFRFGWGHPGELPLYAAVQASAAFPGGFPPRWMRIKRFRFAGGKERPDPLPEVVTLIDGGVYDNMADQWPSGVKRRDEVNPELSLKIPDQLIVVNSSGGLSWSRLKSLKIPFVGEFLALSRAISVMYDNASSRRMRALVDQFKNSQGLDGALVNITQSPFKIPRAYENGTSSASQRARQVIDTLDPQTEQEWERISENNSRVKTTLNGLGCEVSAQLMRHGYALAMANLHVILDFPLRAIPNLEKFKELSTSPGDSF